MVRVFIGVGSNVDSEKSVFGALKLLDVTAPVVAVSTFYRTDPVNASTENPDTPEYINGVVEIRSRLLPVELKQKVLRPVEERFGRVRSADKYLPRTIDLDLLLYGDTVMDEGGLELPDPDITARPFILLPLFELYPDLVLPGSGVEIAGLVKTLKKSWASGCGVASGSGPEMERLDEFSLRLRVEFGLYE